MTDNPTESDGIRHRQSTANLPDSFSTASLNDLAPPVYHNYPSANEYAQAVRAWLWAYHSWQLSSCFAPLWIQQQTAALSAAQTTAAQPAPTSRPQPQQVRPVGGGRICILPTFGRRLMAESIDFVFCFVIKLLVSYALVEIGLINIDKYEKLLTGPTDLKTFIDVTQELFPLEVVHKVLTSLLEAFYISYGIGSVPAGSTPGKFLMGLKVVMANEVVGVGNEPWRATVWPATPVSFLQSLIRAMIKNFALGFLFPVCVGMYMFTHGRSFYDVVAGTIVVEIDPNNP